MAQVDTILRDFILNVLSDEEFQNLVEKDGNQLYFTDLIEYYTKKEAQALMTLFRGQFADWASVPTSIADYASDFAGSKTPTQNNFMVVRDASGYAADACDILSHVQSTGTQYINLGIIPTVGMKYVAKFQASNNTTGTIFGTDSCDMHVYQGEKNPVTEINIGTSTLNTIGVSSGFDVNYELTVKEKGVVSKASNISLSNPYSGDLPTTEMYLFAKNTADVATDFSACIVKGFKVYEGETLLMDLVPARRVLDGAIGFVDIMTNVFYENLGADPLIAGDVVSGGEKPTDTTGSWLFIYNGDWEDNGKSGWTPAFALGGSGGSSLPDQTDNAGKFLTTDGTTASWSDKPLVNNSNKIFALATGGYASAGDYSVAFGFYSISNSLSVAVGYSAEAKQQGSVAVGRLAKAKANYAIQFGWGTNSDANTFKVANQNGNFEMMSADGTIPAERIGNLDFGTME